MTRSIPSAFSLLLLLSVPMWFCGHGVAIADVTYHLPFKSNDLNALEYFSRNNATHAGGTQKFGFDLGAKHYVEDGDYWTSITVTWSTHDAAPKNEYYVIYGKPVYAMQSGTIIRCWRYAPENPRPKKSSETWDDGDKFLHQWLQDKLIPGGGNQIVVANDDGTEALYAHFQTGSIPAALCPIKKSKFDTPDTSLTETTLAEADQVKIKRGQLLGIVGNAGNSTGPHLHIHVTRNGSAELLKFSHGLASTLENNQADIGKWKKFKGNPIPPGPTLIWPPRKLTREYARHGMPADQFQLQFTHLSDSGFQPTWLDVYSTAKRNYINMVWRPATDRWRAYAGISGNRFQQVFDKAKKDKYFPVQTDVGLWGGKPRYAVIFHKNEPGTFRLRWGINDTDAGAEYEAGKAAGMAPISASVVSVGGKRQHTVLYRKSDVGSWMIKSRMTAEEYDKEFKDNLDAGRLPRHIDVYKHSGKSWFAAVFHSRPKGEARGFHGLNGADYQTEFDKSTGKGFLTQAVAGYDGASKHQYAAAWLKTQEAGRATVAGGEPAPARSTAAQSPSRVSATTRSATARTATVSTAASSTVGRSPTPQAGGQDDSWDQGGDPYSEETARQTVRSVIMRKNN